MTEIKVSVDKDLNGLMNLSEGLNSLIYKDIDKRTVFACIVLELYALI